MDRVGLTGSVLAVTLERVGSSLTPERGAIASSLPGV
jgi:hypothetical protein